MFRKASVPAAAEGPRPAPREGARRRLVGPAARIADGLTLRAHGLAVRFDWIPQEFGQAESVDEADPRALRREWLRQLEMWASYNPEQVFAVKAGALMLGGAILLLLILVAAF